MCGRFSLDLPPQVLKEEFGWLEGEILGLPRYNVSPTEEVVAVTSDSRPLLLRWGLIPWYAKKPGKPLIQARSETVAEKSAFAQSFARRRCLIPASGFFEWDRSSGKPLPYHIRRRDGHPLVMAGIYDWWKSPQGEKLGSCCLLTTGANPEVAQVHDRMPVVVEPGDYACWLEGEPDQAAALFGPARASLEVYRVSTVVNKAGNDVPECVVRLEM